MHVDTSTVTVKVWLLASRRQHEAAALGGHLFPQAFSPTLPVSLRIEYQGKIAAEPCPAMLYTIQIH
ncbi:hypothetical protein [Burkholderia metallica]